MKKLSKLNDAKVISKKEQKSINGGKPKLYLCGGFPNPVVCQSQACCNQRADGTWYCD